MGASVHYSSIRDDIRGNCGCSGGCAMVREVGFETLKDHEGGRLRSQLLADPFYRPDLMELHAANFGDLISSKSSIIAFECMTAS